MCVCIAINCLNNNPGEWPNRQTAVRDNTYKTEYRNIFVAHVWMT